MAAADLRWCFEWYLAASPPGSPPAVSRTRDVFEGRLAGAHAALIRAGMDPQEAALLIACAGEVGNNCFDHNLGQWRDEPGCWFALSTEGGRALVAIADRGIGIRATLGRADPSLADDQQAIEAAFARVLSGRAPERRGNGLKFVRSVINGSGGRGLAARSGEGRLCFGGLAAEVEALMPGGVASGVALLLSWMVKP